MILVTGATGLVGAHLSLRLLESNQKVRAIFRSPASLSKTKTLFSKHNKASLFDQMEWIQATLTDLPQLETAFTGITQVYHCAGLHTKIVFCEFDSHYWRGSFTNTCLR